MPIRARLFVIRTGDGVLSITAFSVLSAGVAPFAGRIGADGILTAMGPGAEALNGARSATTPNLNAPPADADPAADPAIRDLLQRMQSEFGSEGDGRYTSVGKTPGGCVVVCVAGAGASDPPASISRSTDWPAGRKRSTIR